MVPPSAPSFFACTEPPGLASRRAKPAPAAERAHRSLVKLTTAAL
jgi:hypothetical protein